MNPAIEALIAVLLIVAIVVAVRVFMLLNQLQKTLKGVDETRGQVDKIIAQANYTILDVNKLMLDQVTPALESVRATLGNVEVTTHAVADATESLRRLTGRADTAGRMAKLVAAGGAVTRTIMQIRAASKKRQKTSQAIVRVANTKQTLGRTAQHTTGKE